MSLQTRLLTELKLRAGMLTAEVAHWQQLAASNQDGMGIHRSQFKAVNLLFEELQKIQDERLEALLQAEEPEPFAEARMDLEMEMVGVHGIMAIFRYILTQRADPVHYREALDAADLIAADCYNLCIQQARKFGALSEFREPPLTYLNALLSPQAYTRNHFFSAFKLQPDHLPELELPVPVISLPFHHTPAIWTYCSIYHEVGHVLDRDLELFQAFSPLLAQRLQERHPIWREWLREVIADVFGILLGGRAFAHALTSLLLLPDTEVVKPTPGDPHPTPYVRIFLLGALLRRAGVPDGAATADELEKAWRERYGEPQDLQPLVDDCAAMAELVLDEPLATALKGRKLRELLVMTVEADGQVRALARFLQKGLLRPQPDGAPPFPYRLIPAAAQIALLDAAADDDAQDIHKRALQFIAAIPRPQFLGPAAAGEVGPSGFTKAREEHLRGMVRKLDFRTLFQRTG